MAVLCARRALLLSSGRADLGRRPGLAILRAPCAVRAMAASGKSDPEAAPAAENSPAFGSSRSPLERLRARQLRDTGGGKRAPPPGGKAGAAAVPAAASFEELRLSEELMAALAELGLSKPTEVQSLGIPAVLAGESVVMASHTGSGKTLAYMLPIVQALRKDEAESGKATRSRRPRCLVLCPTRELAEQVFHVAKSICHHARFRTVMIGGGTRMKSQEDTLNTAVDMIVGTPGRLLMHIKEGHMAYGDIKYVALDEADTMFDRGFAPEIRKILDPLRKRSMRPGDPGFQTVLVTATITKAVQKVLDEEFPGIRHIHTSTLHKKVASARHDFIKLSGTENKLEALQQVLEPSLSKGNRVMVFCNTVNSCRAVDHHLVDNGVATVNYHGEVPANERVENLNKFREDTDGSVPALVCTDLAARGLDLVVDHVVMFDFPYNPIDYLHRTGRTARMGAKGRVTSLVSKRDQTLALQLEDAMSKGQSLEGLTSNRAKAEELKRQELQQGRKQKPLQKTKRLTFKTAKAGSRSGSKPSSSSPVFRAPKGARGKARFEDTSKSDTNTKRPVALSTRNR